MDPLAVEPFSCERFSLFCFFTVVYVFIGDVCRHVLVCLCKYLWRVDTSRITVEQLHIFKILIVPFKLYSKVTTLSSISNESTSFSFPFLRIFLFC